MADPNIDWGRAEIDETSGTLRVPVVNETPMLREEFTRIAQRRNQEVRLEPWGLIAFSAGTIKVDSIEPGNAGQLRDAIEKMLELATQRARVEWADHEREEQASQQEKASRTGALRGMQDEFRSFGDQ